MELAHLKRCFDLGEGDIVAAVESREAAQELLRHMAKISEPNGGAAKSILIFARMATTACEWVEGDLRLEISSDEGGSKVELFAELGLGMRERVLQPVKFNAPLDEFSRAVERVPHMIAPLELKGKTATRISFGATEAIRRSSLPPPPVQIAEDSIFVAPKAPPRKEAPAPALPVITPQLPVVNAEPRTSAPKIATAPVAKSAKPSLERPPLPRPVVKKPDPRSEPEDEEAVDSGWDDGK